MKNLAIHNHPMFGQVRMLTENGKRLTCGPDAARALGYSNPRDALARHCKGVVKRDTPTEGGTQALLFIPDGDLYRLIARSKLPAAEQFESWIFDEIVPSVVDHGAYATDETIDKVLGDPDFGIRLLTELKAEREQRRTLEAQAQADAPKVLFADSVAASEQSILVGELAKLLKQNGVDVGQNRLFARLREEGYLCSAVGDRWNTPTQRAMEMGLFEIKERTINNPDGSVRITRTTKVTGKGQIYFINRYREVLTA